MSAVWFSARPDDDLQVTTDDGGRVKIMRPFNAVIGSTEIKDCWLVLETWEPTGERVEDAS